MFSVAGYFPFECGHHQGGAVFPEQGQGLCTAHRVSTDATVRGSGRVPLPRGRSRTGNVFPGEGRGESCLPTASLAVVATLVTVLLPAAT